MTSSKCTEIKINDQLRFTAFLDHLDTFPLKSHFYCHLNDKEEHEEQEANCHQFWCRFSRTKRHEHRERQSNYEANNFFLDFVFFSLFVEQMSDFCSFSSLRHAVKCNLKSTINLCCLHVLWRLRHAIITQLLSCCEERKENTFDLNRKLDEPFSCSVLVQLLFFP